MKLKPNPRKKGLLPITLGWLILSLIGCSPSVPVSAPTPTTALSYPPPVEAFSLPTQTIYPDPGIDYSAPMPGDDPQPGDDSFLRDRVTLDLETSQVIATITEPASAFVFLRGTLPDACHVLRVVKQPPDSDNNIQIDVYSLVNRFASCPDIPVPFSSTVTMRNYPAWNYTVLVNGEQLIDTAKTYAAQPGDAALTRNEVILDLAATKLDTIRTQPDVMAVDLNGDLPDSCHQLRIVPKPSDGENMVDLEVYSVFDPKAVCTALTQPFHIIYPLGYTTGFYSVLVNGQFIGKFEWGG